MRQVLGVKRAAAAPLDALVESSPLRVDAEDSDSGRQVLCLPYWI